MSDHAKLVRKFRQVLDSVARAICVDGVIKTVHEADFTCTVTVGDIDFYAVPMKVLISATQPSVVEVPTVGTKCTLLFKDKSMDRPTMLYVQSSDKLLIKIGSSTVDIQNDLIKFNGGSLNGLVKIDDLVTKLNNLESRANGIVTSFTTLSAAMTALGAVPVLGTALGTAITTATTPVITPLTPTVRANIENTKIKQ